VVLGLLLLRKSLMNSRNKPIPASYIQLTVIVFLTEDNESASEEAVWLAEDTRKGEYFSGASKIQSGLGVGART
jgi:hypothetical protein